MAGSVKEVLINLNNTEKQVCRYGTQINSTADRAQNHTHTQSAHTGHSTFMLQQYDGADT